MVGVAESYPETPQECPESPIYDFQPFSHDFAVCFVYSNATLKTTILTKSQGTWYPAVVARESAPEMGPVGRI